uniref:Uncharacterized protein n=1 Tax=Sinocyclocheilus anshuiensis TaxID=1608454 RepID=A0A671SY58_9TELE
MFLAQAREKGQLVFFEGLKNSIGVILQEDTSQETQPLSYLRHHRFSLEGLLVLFSKFSNEYISFSHNLLLK